MGFFSDEDEEWKEQVKCFRKVIYPRGISEDVKQEAEDRVYSTVKKWNVGVDVIIFFMVIEIINNGFTSEDVKLMLVLYVVLIVVRLWAKSKVVDVAKQLQSEKDNQSGQAHE